MGQQQLLLIVLGVIIVGIAVVVGINLFNAQAEESAKDALISTATNLGAMMQQYAKKPEAMGGGGGDFTGFADMIEPTVARMEDADVQIGDITVDDAGSITITAADYTEWQVKTTVTTLGISSTVEIK